MTKAYKFAISYFLFFSLLLLVSGALLFEQKIGFSIDGILNYYLGNESSFTQPKSAFGVLKTVLPHIFAFGLFAMVIMHFLIFTKERNKAKTKVLIYLTLISALLEIGSPFFIIIGADIFAYIKFISFVLFEALIIYISWLLFYSILKIQKI